MNIWIISREYAGIAEAGGVKNVACSISESLVKLGHKATLFIPLYGCTDLTQVENFCCFWHTPVEITVEQKKLTVSFSHGILNGVEIIFIGNKAFSVKQAVYTYTKDEELKNPQHKKGQGHEDVKFLNTLFQKAVAAYGSTCSKEEAPQIIHCQDAPTALLPAFINQIKNENKQADKFYKKTKCVVTIHNAGAGYHHEFADLKEAEYYTSLPEKILKEGNNNGRIEPFLVAAPFSRITTVSPEYANEILSQTVDTDGLGKEFNLKNISVTGITNGIEFDKYDPQDTSKSCLPFSFNPQTNDLTGKYNCRIFLINSYACENAKKINEIKGIEKFGFLSDCNEKTVYVAYHGRVVHQKGIEIMAQSAASLLNEFPDVKFIFAGQGAPELEQHLINLAEQNKGKVVYFRGYDKMLSRLSIASADFSLHPSYFEPCGLEDFTSQTYGTIPVAHATGGLCKILNGKTGFLYSPNTSESLSKVLSALLTLSFTTSKAFLQPIIQYASTYIHQKYPWDKVVENEYLSFFNK